MDIEKLIKEQKKTQEAIKLLRESDNYDELMKRVPEVGLDIGEDPHVNNWDYEDMSEKYDAAAAFYISKATELFGKAKHCLAFVENEYNGHIREWERIREFYLKKKTHKDDWKSLYRNPECLKFFEDYEKAHGIKNSIYQEAKNENKRAK